jgi:hypothetical protein
VLIATGAGPQIAQTAPAGLTASGAIGSTCDAGGPGFDPSYGFDALLDAELPNGTDVIGTSHIRGHTVITVLHALTAGCKPVTSFGTNGTDTVSLEDSPSWQGQFGEIDTMTPTPNGGLVIGGTDGPDEVVGPLLANGRLDPSFGTSGWARFSPQEKALGPEPPVPIATSITEASSGTIYVGGDDSEAHCCVQDFAAALTPSGRLESSFGRGGWVDLSMFEGSFITDVFAWRGGCSSRASCRLRAAAARCSCGWTAGVCSTSAST